MENKADKKATIKDPILDDIYNFFNITKPEVKKKISTIRTTFTCDDNEETPTPSVVGGIAYAEKPRSDLIKLEQKMVNDMKLGTVKQSSELDEIESIVSADTAISVTVRQVVGPNYVFSYNDSYDLPIMKAKKKIVDTIRNNKFIVINGATGCGKTTQVPQFIIEDAFTNNESVNIIVTQPRRIAAITIAERVAKERKWVLGSEVGYKVGLKQVACNDTILLYCTTGILLEKLILSKSVKQYSHIILDEVHERDSDMDLLMAVIKYLILPECNTKVILMSATFDTNKFAEYFSVLQPDGTNKSAPIVELTIKTKYPVHTFYLDDCKVWCNHSMPVFNYDTPKIHEDIFNVAFKLIICSQGWDEIEQDQGGLSTILIFLPGIGEIEEFMRICNTELEKKRSILEDNNRGIITNIHFIPLHSSLPTEEQAKIFTPIRDGGRKVILSTNIAESSITLPEVKYVIDFCLSKEISSNQYTNLPSLNLTWASRSSCLQRAGRVGRVSSGRVYRMITKSFYLNALKDYGEPEILRCPLETIVLKAKRLHILTPRDVLGITIDPPDMFNIHKTVLTLKEVGGLLKTCDGEYDEYNGDLTFMGQIMASLPLDVRISRFILIGYIFNVLEETIIMAAGITNKSIFSNYIGINHLKSYQTKCEWGHGMGSDLIAILNAYQAWQKYVHRGVIRNSMKEFCDQYNLELNQIKEMDILMKEIYVRLSQFGITIHGVTTRPRWQDNMKMLVLKTVIAGGFYPYLFSKTNFNEQDQEVEIYKSLYFRNPMNTIYFTGLKKSEGEMRPLYRENIRSLLREAISEQGIYKNLKITFESISEKIFIEFPDMNNSCYSIRKWNNIISIEMLKCLKLRTIAKNSQYVEVLGNSMLEKQYAESIGLKKIKKSKLIKTVNEELGLPGIDLNQFEAELCHCEKNGTLWILPDYRKSDREKIIEELNNYDTILEKIEDLSVLLEMIIAAPNSSFQNKFCRGRVLTKEIGECTVHFIDFGVTEKINIEELRAFNESCSLDKIPPCVIKCRLTQIGPHNYLEDGHWSDQAMDYIQQFCKLKLQILVFSAVNGQISVEIINSNGKFLSLELKQLELAKEIEESYLSKHDHENRRQFADDPYNVTEKFGEEDEEYDFNRYIPRPELPREKRRIVPLKGPFSPLETKIHTLFVNSMDCVIEKNSVNSVLLENNPQAWYTRYVTATNLSLNKSRNRISTFNTTLLPDIPGFGALVALMFCPSVSFNCNRDSTAYTAILTGLGYYPDTNQPLYAEHDLTIQLDVEISKEDVQQINYIRYCMDGFLQANEYDGHNRTVNITQKEIKEYSVRLMENFSLLIRKKRNLQNRECQIDDSLWIKKSRNLDYYAQPSQVHKFPIFSMHRMMRLGKMSEKKLKLLHANCKMLHELAAMYKYAKGENVTCEVCQYNIDLASNVRLHLSSRIHQANEVKINYK